MVESVYISFLSPISCETPTNNIFFLFSDWDSFRDILHDITWKGFQSSCSKVCHWGLHMCESLAFMPTEKYQMKPWSPPWLSPTFSAAIAHFFWLYQSIRLNYNRRLFAIVRRECKYGVKEAKSLFTDRMKHHIISHKFGSIHWWRFCKCVLDNRKSGSHHAFNQIEVLTSTEDNTESFFWKLSSNSTVNSSVLPMPDPPTPLKRSLYWVKWPVTGFRHSF